MEGNMYNNTLEDFVQDTVNQHQQSQQNFGQGYYQQPVGPGPQDNWQGWQPQYYNQPQLEEPNSLKDWIIT